MINIYTMSDEEISEQVEKGNFYPHDLPELYSLLNNLFFPKAALAAALRARNEQPNNLQLWLRLAEQYMTTRDFYASAETLLSIFEQIAYIHLPLLDQLINQALWAGQHCFVETLYRHNSGMLIKAILKDDGYYRDALLTYAGECSHELLQELLMHMLESVVAVDYEDQLPTISANKFSLSGFNYSGNYALITFLLYVGCRVDSIAERWSKPISIDANREIRERKEAAPSTSAHFFLNRAFIFQKHLSCQNFSHRKPNHLLAAQKCIYLTRDPRTAFATWIRPSLTTLQTGAYERFITVHAHYWNDFATSLAAATMGKLIRFEDWKSGDGRTAYEICDFAGISVRGSQLQEAIQLADSKIDRAIKTRDTGAVRYSQWDNDKLDPEHQRLMAKAEELICHLCNPGMRQFGYL